jgi:hypothetical protein
MLGCLCCRVCLYTKPARVLPFFGCICNNQIFRTVVSLSLFLQQSKELWYNIVIVGLFYTALLELGTSSSTLRSVTIIY